MSEDVVESSSRVSGGFFTPLVILVARSLRENQKIY